MNQNYSKKLKEIIPVEFPMISLVYLFGSQVTGKIGPMSDYDFAILGIEDHDTHFQFQHAVSELLPTNSVDIVLLAKAPVELTYKIITTGKVIYQKDLVTKVEFEAEVLGKYGDYLPVLQMFKKDILEGGGYDQRVQRYREAFGRTHGTAGTTRTPQIQG